MSTDIYYFSGTGNSLTVAKNIAAKTGGRLIPISAFREKAIITIDAQVIGIIFPVYYGDPPAIVKEFVERIENLQEKYIFAICTYGGAAMASLRVLRRLIRSKGGRLSAAFGVHMPQNSFHKPKEDHMKLIEECEKRSDYIANKIRTKARGIFYTNYLLELLLIPIQPLIIRPICRKDFARKTNMSPDSKLEELVRMLDKGFCINDRCNGCGICAKVCPVKNILLDNNKPTWQHHCETCLACYNWCPQRAIEGGITSKDYFYRHKDIKISEIMKQQDFSN